MRSLLSIILTLTVSIHFGHAQVEKVEMRFLSFPPQNETEPLELVVGKAETIQVDTPSHELSSTYRVTRLNTVTVGKTIIDSEGKATFQSYGQAKSIADRDQIILLLRKGKENSDGFVVIPISANMENFTGASFLFINTSNLVVKGTIGNQKLDLSPGKMEILKPKPNFSDGICQVTLAYIHGDKEKRFFDTRWPANKNVRSMVIFFQNPQTGRIGLTPITDIIGGSQSTQLLIQP
jgi:hypothetical protein